LRAELDELPQLQTPCILHWDLNHFVVLVSVRRGVATIHDPAQGVRRLKLAQVSPHFTGVALELTPGPGFAPRQERRSLRVRELLGPVSGLKRALAQVLLLALALEAFVLLAPFYMQWVVDDVLVSGDRDLLLTLGVGFALLVLIQVLTAAGRGWAVLVLSATLNLQWLLNVFAHLLRLPVAWFEKRHIGDIWSRFSSVQAIQKALTTSFIEAVLDGALVVLTLAMMAVYSLRLTAVALAAVAVYGLLRWAFMRPLREATEEALVHEARQSSHFLESLRGVQAIKLFAAQADRRTRFAALVAHTMNADITTRKLELGAALAHRLLFGLERVAVIWLGALLVLERSLSVGMLFAFFAYKEQFALRVSGLIDKLVALRMLRLQGERLADIVLTPPEADDSASAAAPGADPAAGIELVDVSFRYADGEPEVLSHVSLRIEPGESVAITGAVGLRQDHAAEDHAGRAGAHRRRGAHRRAGGHGAAAAPGAGAPPRARSAEATSALELRAPGLEAPSSSACAHLAHQVHVVVQVVDAGQHRAQHLAAAVQVVQVGAAEAGAGHRRSAGAGVAAAGRPAARRSCGARCAGAGRRSG
jgi:ATP-binding cassette subfamily B protein RaxB